MTFESQQLMEVLGEFENVRDYFYSIEPVIYCPSCGKPVYVMYLNSYYDPDGVFHWDFNLATSHKCNHIEEIISEQT